MIPFLWLFRLNPVGPAVMVGLFGVATVFLVYKTGRDFFDPKAGLMAAGLYAISPVVIAYSRSSWNPNLMPFFCLLIIYLLWLTVKKKQLSLIGLLGVLLGITFQLHYLATFLVPVMVIYLLVYTWAKKNFKYYLAGVGGFLLGWLPFLLFELRHHFPNFRTLYQFVFFGEETGFVAANIWPTISDVSLRLFSRLVTNNQLFLAQLTLLLSFSTLGYFWLKKKKKKERQVYSLLGLWLILGIGLFSFYQKPIYDYYLGFIFPLPFLLVGLTLSSLSKSFLGKITAGILFASLVVINLQGISFRYQPNHQLDQTKQVAKVIFDEARGKPLNLALITGQNSDHAYRYFLEIWGNPPVVIKNPQVDPERETVTDQLFVVCETLPCHPEGHSLWEIAGFGRAEIEKEWDVSVLKVYKLKHWQEER
jgi:4-amino-4-deoxy-L-arabinose transferase-like glycosyltransferase